MKSSIPTFNRKAKGKENRNDNSVKQKDHTDTISFQGVTKIDRETCKLKDLLEKNQILQAQILTLQNDYTKETYKSKRLEEELAEAQSKLTDYSTLSTQVEQKNTKILELKQELATVEQQLEEAIQNGAQDAEELSELRKQKEQFENQSQIAQILTEDNEKKANDKGS